MLWRVLSSYPPQNGVPIGGAHPWVRHLFLFLACPKGKREVPPLGASLTCVRMLLQREQRKRTRSQRRGLRGCSLLLEEHLAGALSNLAVLLVEDAKRILERLDLGLAACDALLVAHARVHARRAELLERLQGLVEQILRVRQSVEVGHKITAGAVQVSLGLLLPGLLRRDRRLRLLRERGEIAGRLVLLGLSGLERPHEVRRDGLEHADDARALRLVARVRALRTALDSLGGHVLRNGRRLHESRALVATAFVAILRLRRALVVIGKHLDRLLQGRETLLRIGQGLLVVGLVLLALLRRLQQRLVELCELLRERRDRLLQLRDGCLAVRDGGVQLDGVRMAILTVLLSLADLRVAPALVGRLVPRLLEQALDELLDEDLHLGEWVPSHLHHQGRERETLLVLRSGRERGDHAAAQLGHGRLLLLVLDGAHLREDDVGVLLEVRRRGLGLAVNLRQTDGRGLLRRRAATGTRRLREPLHRAGEDLEGLGDGRDLAAARHGALVPLLRLHLAGP